MIIPIQTIFPNHQPQPLHRFITPNLTLLLVHQQSMLPGYLTIQTHPLQHYHYQIKGGVGRGMGLSFPTYLKAHQLDLVLAWELLPPVSSYDLQVGVSPIPPRGVMVEGGEGVGVRILEVYKLL